MMTILKVVLSIFVAFCVLVVFTYGWVVAQSRGTKATGLDVLRAITIYSPLWWLLVAALVAVIWWLCRRWLF